ncbi:MAG: hypothetical protein F6K50_42045 [Moorea sp. SIO3I7]|uniref:Uncharacterized protein n=1 Tax=Moorena bouillonii PNG TaxID=568701 RepID=A0A1U7N0T0_9CYAN|nr:MULTISPECIES: hypothetical protein [Moorena]NEO01739.1 hypothetical protein [Moorena sp. SIO3I7]OLT59504.1 hypothetical protein BJP37_11140 [Moorena bouillonii PNG]
MGNNIKLSPVKGTKSQPSSLTKTLRLALPVDFILSTILVYHKKYIIIAYFENFCNKFFLRESGAGGVGFVIVILSWDLAGGKRVRF